MTERAPFVRDRREPIALHYLKARLPLVHASRHYFELREDYLQVARAIEEKKANRLAQRLGKRHPKEQP